MTTTTPPPPPGDTALLGRLDPRVSKACPDPRQLLTHPSKRIARQAAKVLAEEAKLVAAWKEDGTNARIREAIAAKEAVERARKARREEQAYTALLPTIAALLPTATHYTRNVWDDRKAKYLADLVAEPGGKTTITAEKHQDCPGHAYQLCLASPFDTNPDVTQDGVGFDLRWLCTDWRTNGHHDQYGRSDSSDSSGPEAGTEEARQQRRMTVDLNKAGDAAKTVRQEWLTTFTVNGKGGRHLPDSWHLFMLDALDETHLCSEEKHTGLPHVLQLLGITNLASTALSDKGAGHILLCTRLWTLEQRATREIWRSTSHRDYLSHLAGWGYPLSPVEQAGAGRITAEQAHEQLQEQPC